MTSAPCRPGGAGTPGGVGAAWRAGQTVGVDVTATLTADVGPDALFDVVEDLGTYPSWLDIVPRADVLEPRPATTTDRPGRWTSGARWVRCGAPSGCAWCAPSVTVPGAGPLRAPGAGRPGPQPVGAGRHRPPARRRRWSGQRADDGAALRRVDVDAAARPAAVRRDRAIPRPPARPSSERRGDPGRCAGPGLAGTAVTRWGRPGTARAPTSRCSPRWPSPSTCACSTRTARRSASRLPECVGYGLARLPARRRARAALRVPGRRRRTGAPGDLQPPLEAAAGPLRQGGRRLDPLARRGATPTTTRTRRPDVPRSVVVNPWFDWGVGPSPATPAGTRPCSTRPTCKGLTALHPDVPDQHRGTYLGLCAPPVHRPPAPPGRDRGRAACRPPVRPRPPPGRDGAAQLLGLQLDRVLRAAQRVRGRRRRRRAGAASSR